MIPPPTKLRKLNTSQTAADSPSGSQSFFTQSMERINSPLFPSTLSDLPYYLSTPTPVVKFNSLLVNRIETILQNASLGLPVNQREEYDFTFTQEEEGEEEGDEDSDEDSENDDDNEQPLQSSPFTSPSQDTAQLAQGTQAVADSGSSIQNADDHNDNDGNNDDDGLSISSDIFGDDSEDESDDNNDIDVNAGNGTNQQNNSPANNATGIVGLVLPPIRAKPAPNNSKTAPISSSKANVNSQPSKFIYPSPNKAHVKSTISIGPTGADGMYTISNDRGASFRVLAPQFIPNDIKFYIKRALGIYNPYITKYITRIDPIKKSKSRLNRLGYRLIVQCNKCNHLSRPYSTTTSNLKNHLLLHGISVSEQYTTPPPISQNTRNNDDNGRPNTQASNQNENVLPGVDVSLGIGFKAAGGTHVGRIHSNSERAKSSGSRYFKWGFPRRLLLPDPKSEKLWDILLHCLQEPQVTLDVNLNSLDFRAFVMNQSRSLVEFTKNVIKKFDSVVSLAIHEIDNTVLVTGKFLPVNTNITQRMVDDLDSTNTHLRLVPLDGFVLGVRQFSSSVELNSDFIDATGSKADWIVDLIEEFDVMDRVKYIVVKSTLFDPLRERLDSETILFIEPINVIIDEVISNVLHSLHQVFPALMDDLKKICSAVNNRGSYYYDEWNKYSETPLISPDCSESVFSRLYFYYTTLRFKKKLDREGNVVEGSLGVESEEVETDRMLVMIIILMDICEVTLCHTNIPVVQMFNKMNQILEFFSLLNQSVELGDGELSTEKTIGNLLFARLSDKQVMTLKKIIESTFFRIHNYMERLKDNNITFICEALSPSMKLTTLKHVCSTATFLRESANTYIYFDKLLHVVSPADRLAAARGTTRNPVFDYIQDLVDTATKNNVDFYRRMQRGKFNEFERYMLEPLSDGDFSTFEEYWILNFQKFPRLSKFALTVFATNCNSVALEKIYLESLPIIRGPVNMMEEGELIQGLVRIKYFLGFYQLQGHVYRKTTFPSTAFLGSYQYINSINRLVSEKI